MKVLKFWTVLALVSLLAIGCGKKSGLEGKVVDGEGQPLANVKVVASQVQPIKGYEQLEAVTKSDGTFRLNGLYPSSQYILNFLAEKWTYKPSVRQDSALLGETAILPSPVVIPYGYSKSGSVVLDLVTGATRFVVSSEGVITDSKTTLEWVVGPDRDTDYAQAEQWVADCKVKGGGWRMPNREELKTLYMESFFGGANRDPVFKTTGSFVWAEPEDSSKAWRFGFPTGPSGWSRPRSESAKNRVFGVRSRP